MKSLHQRKYHNLLIILLYLVLQYIPAVKCEEIELGGAKTVHLDDDSFYDLSAKLFNKKDVIHFNRFDGYLTVISNIGKYCKDTRDIVSTIEAMQSLFKIMPYSLNIILFPFKIPDIDYSKQDCSGFDNAIENASKNKILQNKLFFMEDATLNGPDVHPVYEYLKLKTEQPKLIESHATFYFVNGEGTKIEVFQGASFDRLRSHIISLTKDGYGL